jgi:hypothetical protein
LEFFDFETVRAGKYTMGGVMILITISVGEIGSYVGYGQKSLPILPMDGSRNPAWSSLIYNFRIALNWNG